MYESKGGERYNRSIKKPHLYLKGDYKEEKQKRSRSENQTETDPLSHRIQSQTEKYGTDCWDPVWFTCVSPSTLVPGSPPSSSSSSSSSSSIPLSSNPFDPIQAFDPSSLNILSSLLPFHSLISLDPYISSPLSPSLLTYHYTPTAVSACTCFLYPCVCIVSSSSSSERNVEYGCRTSEDDLQNHIRVEKTNEIGPKKNQATNSTSMEDRGVSEYSESYDRTTREEGNGISNVGTLKQILYHDGTYPIMRRYPDTSHPDFLYTPSFFTQKRDRFPDSKYSISM